MARQFLEFTSGGRKVAINPDAIRSFEDNGKEVIVHFIGIEKPIGVNATYADFFRAIKP